MYVARDVDAIYIGGVLKPLGSVSLHESERVRLTARKKILCWRCSNNSLRLTMTR